MDGSNSIGGSSALSIHVLSPQAQMHERRTMEAAAAAAAAQQQHHGFTSPQSAGSNSSHMDLMVNSISPHPNHPDLQLPSPSPMGALPIMSSPGHPSQIMAQSPGPVGPQSPTDKPLGYVEAMLLLTKGEDFLKYSAHRGALASLFSAPATKRHVWYEKEAGSMGKLYWCAPGRRTKDPSRCIPLSTVTALYEQASTDAFAKAKLTAEERERCFSIVSEPKPGKNILKADEKAAAANGKGRTLDLMASTKVVRDTWLHCIHQILTSAGYDVREALVSSPKAADADKAQAEKKTPTSASEQAIAAAKAGGSTDASVSSPGSNPSSSPQNLNLPPAALNGAASSPSNSAMGEPIEIASTPQNSSRAADAREVKPFGPSADAFRNNAAAQAPAANKNQKGAKQPTLPEGSPRAEDAAKVPIPPTPQSVLLGVGGPSRATSPQNQHNTPMNSPANGAIAEQDEALPTSPINPAHASSPTRGMEQDLPNKELDASGVKLDEKKPATTEGEDQVLANGMSVSVQLVDDPLLQAKLHRSLSPGSAAQLDLPHDLAREIPAELSVPASLDASGPDETSKMKQLANLLSPSEHPTQTPACSPVCPQ